MASAKPDLARAGTMQITAKEGANFLDRNLTEWKKPYLTDHLNEEEEEEAETDGTPNLAKNTTMKTTAKEAEVLGDAKPDDDALTRGQQKKIDQINAEKAPPAKKANMSKATTMVATAKEAKALLGGEKLADTRQETKKRKPAAKRVDTIAQTKAEAEAVFGKLDHGEGRSLRKRPEQPKPAMKKAGTMHKTAKEGKDFLKRSKKAATKKSDS